VNISGARKVDETERTREGEVQCVGGTVLPAQASRERFTGAVVQQEGWVSGGSNQTCMRSWEVAAEKREG